MDTTSFTKRQRIVKIRVVLILGLAVLVGSSTVTWAEPKFKIGTTSCRCTCADKTNHKNYSIFGWEKVGACQGAVGKNCSFKKPGDTTATAGELTECQQCFTGADGMSCGGPQSNTQGTTAPVRPGVVEPGPRTPSTDPFSKSGMNAPIHAARRRG